MPRERLIPCGIPVNEQFSDRSKGVDRAVLEVLNLSPNLRHILVVGGSVGAGSIPQVAHILSGYIKRFNKKVDEGIIRGRKLHGIVICGNNDKIYKKLRARYKDVITVLKRTDNMSDYMKSCDIVISKPGGLSSTEAAVARVPLIHISPIPGCETFNVKYFDARGMSVYVENVRKDLASAITALLKPENRAKMLASQEISINENARDDLCDFVEKITKK